MQAVLFTNWTSQDFVGTWNKVTYPIKAGQSQYFEDYLANHFAKHLVDQYFNLKNMRTNDVSREELEKKCFAGEIPARSEEDVKQVVLNANANMEVKEIKEVVDKAIEKAEVKKFCEFCDSKGGRHLKTCKLYKPIVKKEDAFEGK